VTTGLLHTIPLAETAISPTTTFGEAAELLDSSGAPALALVDDTRRVVGLFGPEEALRSLLPRYLEELRHTAFAREDRGILAEQAARVRDEPVERHAAEPVTVERGTSALHVGEVFLHSGLPAIAVVEQERFVGVLARRDLVAALVGWLGEGAGG
jgi:CBS domain-containing protein